MLDGLLKEQVRADPDIAGMLTSYKGKPAFFYQKAPSDTDRGWTKPCYPRADYNLNMRYDPERKVSGGLSINVWCTNESAAMPEDIEKRFVELIGGTFYTDKDNATVCAIWNRSDAFTFEGRNTGGATTQEVFGVTILFDLTEYPCQITTTPDPIQGANLWAKARFPDVSVIAHDNLPPVWKPTDLHPAVYWRYMGADTDSRQTYAATWYNGRFAVHVIAESIAERNKWIKAIAEELGADLELLLTDGSPMFIQNVSVNHAADPLREGQIAVTGRYGVLRREYAGVKLGDISISIKTD